jgi:hypothetical protein
MAFEFAFQAWRRYQRGVFIPIIDTTLWEGEQAIVHANTIANIFDLNLLSGNPWDVPCWRPSKSEFLVWKELSVANDVISFQKLLYPDLDLQELHIAALLYEEERQRLLRLGLHSAYKKATSRKFYRSFYQDRNHELERGLVRLLPQLTKGSWGKFEVTGIYPQESGIEAKRVLHNVLRRYENFGSLYGSRGLQARLNAEKSQGIPVSETTVRMPWCEAGQWCFPAYLELLGDMTEEFRLPMAVALTLIQVNS